MDLRSAKLVAAAKSDFDLEGRSSVDIWNKLTRPKNISTGMYRDGFFHFRLLWLVLADG